MSSNRCLAAAWLAVASALSAPPWAVAADAPVPLPSLNVAEYMGTWYQVAWYPNRFQKQCVSDTLATYLLLPEGRVEVLNRCRGADGRVDSIAGIARPVGTLQDGRLQPAQLEVSFLPSWVRWLPVGWGAYWVVHLAEDGRYAIVSEASREYLWVLSRSANWTPSDAAAVQAELQRQGFDLSRLEAHPQTQADPP